MPEKLLVRRAAVLGAGVMGAQIAAHLTNAGVDTVLFDLPASEGDPNGVVNRAIANLGKLSPAPLASRSLAAAITPANYELGLKRLRDCDLIIEAIAERMDWKKDLYEKIAPFVADHAVLASNTSGLGINKLAEALPEKLRPRFCGVHFFNPPRYMHLAELIPARTTDKSVLQGLETFLTSTLGKGVVYARDTPNFIGNRIGVFSILATIHHTQECGLGFDEVDALTGPLVGRPKSATFRTSDVVGLDTMGHVIKTMADTLPDDPWHGYFKSPKWLETLVGNAERPVLFLFAGKAHPADQPGQQVLREIKRIMLAPEFAGHVLFLEDYDIQLARWMVTGVDVWLNNPVAPLEASGTSGIKAAINGRLNLSILDGWWAEAFDGANGWGLPGADAVDEARRDDLDAAAVFDALEAEVVPLYYARNEQGLSPGWVRRCRHAMASVIPRFNMRRVVSDYAENLYRPAGAMGRRLLSDGGRPATELAAWKRRVREHWEGVQILEVRETPRAAGAAGPLVMRAKLQLVGLDPADLCVEFKASSRRHCAHSAMASRLASGWRASMSPVPCPRMAPRSSVSRRYRPAPVSTSCRCACIPGMRC